jgi:hypothetical protein
VSFEAQAVSLGLDPTRLLPYREAAAALDALAVARGGRRNLGYGPSTNTFDVDSIPAEAILLEHREVFLAEKDRLHDLLAIAGAL